VAHAPLFAAFGINVWTVRLPSILLWRADPVPRDVRARASSARMGRAAARAARAPIP
jgi:hypothetical protein